jgi:ABC-2 type transport system ATP-binding protein
MAQNAVLSIKDLTKVYESQKAVDAISFSLEPGKILGLLGPNGAGKTTTINMIMGILEPTSGEIKVFGKNTKTHRSEINAQMNFSAIYAHMLPNITVWQNLYVFGALYEVKNLKQKVAELLKEFDLEKFANTKAGLLSSGELSRLSFAKAVINEPQLLLLDEPTASLDPSIAKDVREKIQAYVKTSNASVLWTSHNMLEIETVCDEVFFLLHGKILLRGNPKTLAQEHGKKDLEELFISIAREPLNFEED